MGVRVRNFLSQLSRLFLLLPLVLPGCGGGAEGSNPGLGKSIILEVSVVDTRSAPKSDVTLEIDGQAEVTDNSGKAILTVLFEAGVESKDLFVSDPGGVTGVVPVTVPQTAPITKIALTLMITETSVEVLDVQASIQEEAAGDPANSFDDAAAGMAPPLDGEEQGSGGNTGSKKGKGNKRQPGTQGSTSGLPDGVQKVDPDVVTDPNESIQTDFAPDLDDRVFQGPTIGSDSDAAVVVDYKPPQTGGTSEKDQGSVSNGNGPGTPDPAPAAPAAGDGLDSAVPDGDGGGINPGPAPGSGTGSTPKKR